MTIKEIINEREIVENKISKLLSKLTGESLMDCNVDISKIYEIGDRKTVGYNVNIKLTL